MKSRTIIAGTLLVSSLIAVPAAVMAGGPAGAGGGDMDQIHAVQQDMVRTRDRIHDQSLESKQTLDRVQTREQTRTQDRTANQTATQSQTRAQLHAQDRAAARTATKSQARSGRRNGQ